MLVQVLSEINGTNWQFYRNLLNSSVINFACN